MGFALCFLVVFVLNLALLQYPTCVYCLASTTCNGNGFCNTTSGLCHCNSGTSPPSCSGCAPNCMCFVVYRIASNCVLCRLRNAVHMYLIPAMCWFVVHLSSSQTVWRRPRAAATAPATRSPAGASATPTSRRRRAQTAFPTTGALRVHHALVCSRLCFGLTIQ